MSDYLKVTFRGEGYRGNNRVTLWDVSGKTIETLEIDSTRWHRLENRDRERVMFEVLSRKYQEVDWKYANIIEVTKA